MKPFIEVIYDDELRKFDLMGPSTNDSLLTDNTVLLQQSDFKVHCQTADIGVQDAPFENMGYQRERGLYYRLLDQYETKTGKRVKRW